MSMEIKLHEITVRDVTDGYVDSDENGVVGYGGKLNIRPAYQREFIYKEKQRDAVIDTVMHGFPLNIMYWATNEDGKYELLDGQQRTVSLCQYVAGDFSIQIDNMPMKFDNLSKTEQEQILNYKLMIYVCTGSDKEKLDWFKVININSVALSDQELRNAIYTGKWLTEAKKYFSKSQCPASQLADKYLAGVMNRQAFLETALKWISTRDGKSIEDYMSEHQHDSNCNELWLYFQSVINWVTALYPKYRKEMKGLPWGEYYNVFGKGDYDPSTMEQQVQKLMMDDDVTSKKGVYAYILSGDEKYLSIRKFPNAMKRAAYERQKGICVKCGKHFELAEMEGDHITPWSQGGKTTSANCQMLCKDCNRRKSDK